MLVYQRVNNLPTGASAIEPGPFGGTLGGSHRSYASAFGDTVQQCLGSVGGR